jgi:hypothetical protein
MALLLHAAELLHAAKLLHACMVLQAAAAGALVRRGSQLRTSLAGAAS